MSEMGGTQLFQGKITHTIDPFNFWAQIGTESDFNQFKRFEDELNVFCDKVGFVGIKGNLNGFECGCFILVKQRTLWQRAEVARVDRDNRRIDVVYLDYGDTDMVPISQVCSSCPCIFFCFKPQAFKCRIAGIQPLAKNWTTRGIKCFKNQTKDKIFQTAIVFEDPQYMYHEVSLYNSDEEGRSLAYILMEEEIGLPSDNEVPEFAKDVLTALPESYLENFQYDTDYTSPVSFDQSDTNSPCEDLNQANEKGSYISDSDSGSANQLYLENSAAANQNAKSKRHSSSLANNKSCNINPLLNCTVNDDSSVSQDPLLGASSSQIVSPDSSTTEETLPSHQIIYSNAWSTTNSEKMENMKERQSHESSNKCTIPSFDVSAMMETKTLCLAALQEERDVERRVTTKSKAIDNLAEIYEELEFERSPEVNWGMSDLSIGKPTVMGNEGCRDVYDNIKSQIDSINPSPQILQNPQSDQETPSQSRGKDVYPKYKVPPHSQHIKEKQFGPKPNNPVKPCVMNNEEREYRFYKQITQLLENIENDDPAIVCDKIHQLVPSGESSCEANDLSVCLEALLDKATADKQNSDKLLKILDSYSTCDIFGPCLEWVIKKLTQVYVRLPIRRKPVHIDYSIVLSQIVMLSKYWCKGTSMLIQDLIISTIEKWIIFNKKGTQEGTEVVSICEMYICCLETIWTTVTEVFPKLYPVKYKYLLNELEEKLVADGLTSDLRSRLLKLFKMSLCVKSSEISESYNGECLLKTEAETQTISIEQSTQAVQTEDLHQDLWSQVHDNNYEEEEEQNYSSDIVNEEQEPERPEHDNRPLVHVSSFSDIHKDESMSKRKGSQSPIIADALETKNTESLMQEYTENVDDGRSIQHKISDFPSQPEVDMRISAPMNAQNASKNKVGTFLDRANLFSPKFSDHKKKSPHKKDKLKHKSWADCVKLDNMIAENANLQSDHLKHLAIQTLKSGILKGKNIQARRQLSSEELRGAKPSVSEECQPQNLKPEGRFLSPKLQETKALPSKLTKRKYIPGRDLPHSAKLTRQMLEENLEKEVMRKYAPKPHQKSTSHGSNQSSKLKSDDLSEWPSLKSEENYKAKLDKKSAISTSLHSIAADILLGENKSVQSSVNCEQAYTVEQNLEKGYNSIDSLREENSVLPRGDNSDTNVESKSGTSGFNDSDELESDFSDDDKFIVTGPVDLAAPVETSKKPIYEHRPTKQEYGWTPKTRTCTSCGETTHIVYDCPEKKSIIF